MLEVIVQPEARQTASDLKLSGLSAPSPPLTIPLRLRLKMQLEQVLELLSASWLCSSVMTARPPDRTKPPDPS